MSMFFQHVKLRYLNGNEKVVIILEKTPPKYITRYRPKNIDEDSTLEEVANAEYDELLFQHEGLEVSTGYPVYKEKE